MSSVRKQWESWNCSAW